MRQLIREESEELRALEARLKAAYVNKERASQITEKQLRVQQAMVRPVGCAGKRGGSGGDGGGDRGCMVGVW